MLFTTEYANNNYKVVTTTGVLLIIEIHEIHEIQHKTYEMYKNCKLHQFNIKIHQF